MTKAPRSSSASGFGRYWPVMVLIALVFLVYWPVTRAGFVGYDDTDFVTANPIVQRGLTWEGFRWAWHSEVARNWHPVTMLSHMLDCQLFGLRAGGAHFDNLLLHAANTALVFYLFFLITRLFWPGFFVAVLFGLHPLHVESVAWIAERKDLLSTFFWLLTFIAYVRYAQNLREKGGRPKLFYAGALIFFALALLSKPMVVTGPFVFLLLDYWPLQRIRLGPADKKNNTPTAKFPARLLGEKIPFFALSAALCVVTYRIQQSGGAMLAETNLSLGARAGNALVSYVRYLAHMIWPVGLNGLYLHAGTWPAWEIAASAVFLIAITGWAIQQRLRRPWFLVGWFWYLGTLVPVIGLVQVGMQSMADRFTYVPLLGIFLIVACALNEWAARQPLLNPKYAAVLIALICLPLTARQVGYWHDSETLFGRMIKVNNKNYMAHYNLANTYSREGKIEAAVTNYQAAVEAEPNYADAHNNFAGLLLDQKRYGEAIQHYRDAVRINPQYLYYFNLANALADAASAHQSAAEFAEAEQTYGQAIALNPQAPDPHNNLGMTWQAQSKMPEAEAEFREAVRLQPGFELAHFNLANALAHDGKLDAAIAEYSAAAKLKPDRVENYNGLGVCYAMQNKMPEATEQFRQIIRLQPNNAGAYGNLGNALGAQNRLDVAVTNYEQALRLNPQDFQTEFNLGLTLARQGKKAEAGAHYQAALRLNPNATEARRALQALEAAH